MKRLALLVCALAAGCAAGTEAPPASPAPPTATLRGFPTPTSTPAFPTALPTDTPLPTLTPAPTATPIDYVIQSGDTLIGIAVDFDVSLEALEALNPGLNPVNLQPGQTILIPPASGQAAPSQATLPTALPVTVGAFACSPTPVASLVCLSEFVNTTGGPIINLSVRVTLLNADNTPGESMVAYSPLDLIPAGAAVPLAAVFAGGGQRAAVGTVLTAESGAGLSDLYATLEVSELALSTEAGAIALTGVAANTSPAAVRNAIAVGTVYNSAGEVIGFRTIVVAEALAAGERAAFSIALPGVSAPARWQVIAQGRTR